jgi:hypothetical protein
VLRRRELKYRYIFFFRPGKGEEVPVNWKFAVVCPVNKTDERMGGFR